MPTGARSADAPAHAAAAAADPRPGPRHGAARANAALRLGLALLLTLLLLPLAGASAQQADLSAAVNRALRDHTPKGASVAVRIVALDGDAPPRVLFDRNPRRAMLPASNLKLLTTAAALDRLGEDFRFRTLLLVRGDLASGTAEIAVIGDGDPAFGDGRLLRDTDGWDVQTVFQTWGRLLREAGVRSVTALYLDDSVFDEEHDHPRWPDNQRHLHYCAQVAGLNLNINVVDFYLTRPRSGGTMSFRLEPQTRYVQVRNTCRVGDQNAVWLTREPGGNDIQLAGQTDAARQGPIAVTVHDPTAYFGQVMAETLRAEGLKVADPVRDRTLRQRLAGTGEVPGGGNDAGAGDWEVRELPWRVLAIHETPISTVIARTNKDSVNMYAESLAKRLAFATTGRSGSWEDADEAVRGYLESIGTDAASVKLDDGSGLSRHSRVTAAALCDVLAHQYRAGAFEMFRDSLAEAGADGTLRNRFGDDSRRHLRGRVFGKTGYISGVSALTVYLQAGDGNWYAVSVLVNDIPSGQVWQARVLQETIVHALDRSVGGR